MRTIRCSFTQISESALHYIHTNTSFIKVPGQMGQWTDLKYLHSSSLDCSMQSNMESKHVNNKCGMHNDSCWIPLHFRACMYAECVVIKLARGTQRQRWPTQTITTQQDMWWLWTQSCPSCSLLVCYNSMKGWLGLLTRSCIGEIISWPEKSCPD